MRQSQDLRALSFETGIQLHAAGSCLIKVGRTHVLCSASLEAKVPGWMKGRGTGWLTAEYGMLPAATHTRSDREAARGKQQGRTVEIQRLIGRSLRQAVDLAALGERGRVVLEYNVTARHDFDAGLVFTVGEYGKIIELTRRSRIGTG